MIDANKAKEKLTRFFENFLKDEKKKFDENFFYFTIKGGSNHSEII